MDSPELFVTYYPSPVGRLQITGSEKEICSVYFADAQKRPAPKLAPSEVIPEILKECIDQLTRYFEGQLQNFTVPYALQGSDFQIQVWKELTFIPYGKTISYGEQARRLGNEKAVRAVASCNGSNRLSILIPCHRVVGANGSLTGYGGDVWAKRWLLEHEQKFSTAERQLTLF